MTITIIFGLLAVLSVVGLYKELRYRVHSLELRVDKLEKTSPKRLPYRSQDAIEDATAALLKVITETEFRNDLLQNALAHLHKARNPQEK